MAGIHDCLKQDRVSEARARASLAILAYDQASLDGGSWQLAQELMLELPPPYSAFQGRRASLVAPCGRKVSGIGAMAPQRPGFLCRKQEASWTSREEPKTWSRSGRAPQSAEEGAEAKGTIERKGSFQRGARRKGGSRSLRGAKERREAEEPAEVHLPGTRASQVEANVFEECFTTLLQSKTPMSFFALHPCYTCSCKSCAFGSGLAHAAALPGSAFYQKIKPEGAISVQSC